MKKIIISAVFIMINLWNSYSISDMNRSENDTVNTKIVTFDGYEGEYFFFTDADGIAVMVEKTKSEKELFKLLQENIAIGKKFVLVFEKPINSKDKMVYATAIKKINYANEAEYSKQALVNSH